MTCQTFSRGRPTRGAWEKAMKRAAGTWRALRRNRGCAALAVTLSALLAASSSRASTMPEYARFSPPTAEPKAPTAVALDGVGNLYVAESSQRRVTVYGPDGLRISRVHGLLQPISLAVDGKGRVVVGDGKTRSVDVYDGKGGLLFQLGAGAGEIARPGGIAVAPSGDIYVVDTAAEIVKVYAEDGRWLFSFGRPGDEDGAFNIPTAITIDRTAGEVLVADLQAVQAAHGRTQGARIQVFGLDGSFRRAFSNFGLGDGKLIKPMGLAVDAAHRIYTSDAYQNVVQVFDTTGVFLGTVYDLEQPLRTPLGVALGEGEKLFVASLNSQRVELYQLNPADHPTATVTATSGVTPTRTATVADTPVATPTDTATVTLSPAATATAVSAASVPPALPPPPTETATPTPTTALHCGDGEPGVGEQCDQGDRASSDGCRADCTYELIPGNASGSTSTTARACLLEWAIANPHNLPATDHHGRPSREQICRDNDSSCDFDPSAGTCLFHVVICLNNDNLASCQPVGVAEVAIKKPSALRDPDNIAALTAGLTRLRDPANGDWLSSPIPASRTNVCTEPIGLRVPIRGIAGRRGDTLKLRTVSRSLPGVAGTVVDVDRIDLLCLPAD